MNAPENLNVASIGKRGAAFATFIPGTIRGLADGTVDMKMALGVIRSAWIDTIRAAEEHNDPGKFTTFIAYEYTTSSDDRGNLHRNVIFKGNDKAPAVPFSRFHSQNPEGLWDWMDDLREQGIESLAKGVTMGGDLLAAKGKAPQFLAWAIRDARSAALQRLQIVKGWIAEGTPKEKVYDVMCSDGLTVDPTTHRCPDNGAKVNLTDCSITADVGDAELKALWKDPDFDADQRAFYYVRVLENPTCRWSTWDAVKAGVPPRPDLKKTIQERAWSSPIWYVP